MYVHQCVVYTQKSSIPHLTRFISSRKTWNRCSWAKANPLSSFCVPWCYLWPYSTAAVWVMAWLCSPLTPTLIQSRDLSLLAECRHLSVCQVSYCASISSVCLSSSFLAWITHCRLFPIARERGITPQRNKVWAGITQDVNIKFLILMLVHQCGFCCRIVKQFKDIFNPKSGWV